MKNADMPAMPMALETMVNEHGTVAVNDAYEGLTKREMFAMHAPCVEPDFEKEFAAKNDLDKDLVALFKGGNCYKLTLKGKMAAAKEWRYAYADLMLEE